jgi:hypothetical protein
LVGIGYITIDAAVGRIRRIARIADRYKRRLRHSAQSNQARHHHDLFCFHRFPYLIRNLNPVPLVRDLNPLLHLKSSSFFVF